MVEAGTEGALRTLLLMPALGAAALLLLPTRKAHVLRHVALGVALLAFGYALWLLSAFDATSADAQFIETRAWNPRLGSAFALGMDGLSMPMVLLATLLTAVAIAASVSVTRARGYFALLLLLESAMLGVFLARDWSLFYVFWELTLLPLFFLIDRWGGKDRHRAALSFVLYTMGGSVFMLIALLVLFDVSPGHAFDMEAIIAGARELPVEVQIPIFLGLLVGFGVKMPIFPLHGWLPLAHVEAPSPVSILLSGILLKMGSYGLLRAIEMLPEAAAALSPLLAALAFASLIYGGVLAWYSRDLKAMIAYSSVSHMGVVLLGIAALNVAGLTGATYQMVAHGLTAGALFLLVGLLYERTHTRDLADYSGLVWVTPRFAFFTVLAFVAAVGMPGTAGFIAELHALIGGFERWGFWILLLSLSILISAAYAVRTVSHLFTGGTRTRLRDLPDLTRTEMVTAGALTFGSLALGIFPAPLIALAQASVARLAHAVGV